jgi:hypothetical protein
MVRSTPVDLRSSFRLLIVALGIAAGGCGRNAVRASEKQFLADQIMVFDNDPQETSAEGHVLDNRAGASGGRGAGGGGCGCN